MNGATTLTATGTIDGAGALTKLGAGTLVLAGSNSYSGGTNFNAGVVSISANDNLGTGPLTFNGGTLQSSGPVDLAMGGTINAPGGTIDTLPGMLTVAGDLTGAGALTKTGVGTLVLTGTNTYSGGTTISDGTLILGNGGSTGSITGNVVNNGQLFFDRSNEYVFDGVISGSGSVAQLGSGTTILTGTNTYAGDTDVFSRHPARQWRPVGGDRSYYRLRRSDARRHRNYRRRRYRVFRRHAGARRCRQRTGHAYHQWHADARGRLDACL